MKVVEIVGQDRTWHVESEEHPGIWYEVQFTYYLCLNCSHFAHYKIPRTPTSPYACKHMRAVLEYQQAKERKLERENDEAQ